MHHKLDLGQNSLPGAQQCTTVKAAAAIKVQDKAIKVQDKAIKVQDKEDTSKVHMSDNNGQNSQEIYRRAEYIIPQLDGTHNVRYQDQMTSEYADCYGMYSGFL